jgi:hypothetical protein
MNKSLPSHRSRISILCFIIIGIAAVGTYLFIISHAATPYATHEAETGTLANGADAESSTTASGDKFVTFNGVRAASCQNPHGPFTINGNKVMDSNDQVFKPYGVTIFGLSEADWQPTIASDESQIDAMANYWCANTVRIQASPDNLYTNITAGKTYNATYLGDVEAEVSLALKDNLNVVLTAQTEHTEDAPGPMIRTLDYWKIIGTALNGESNIIFDLFNEPRIIGSTTAATWSMWQNGGTHDGESYLGMQTLVTDLRQAGIDRMFWVEGPYSANTLQYVPSYPITGSGIVYDFHHPGGGDVTTTADWNTYFGNLAETKPVVDGEWTNYSMSPAAGPCWQDAQTAVPAYLAYLKSKQIGVMGWNLEQNVLISGTALNVPTQILSNYTCGVAGQGAGQALMNYFQTNNTTP